MLGNTPDMLLYLIYTTKIVWQKRGTGVRKKTLVTPDLPNHGITSLDVMTAKSEIFGFLAGQILLTQKSTDNSYRRRWDCFKFTIGVC